MNNIIVIYSPSISSAIAAYLLDYFFLFKLGHIAGSESNEESVKDESYQSFRDMISVNRDSEIVFIGFSGDVADNPRFKNNTRPVFIYGVDGAIDKIIDEYGELNKKEREIIEIARIFTDGRDRDYSESCMFHYSFSVPPIVSEVAQMFELIQSNPENIIFSGERIIKYKNNSIDRAILTRTVTRQFGHEISIINSVNFQREICARSRDKLGNVVVWGNLRGKSKGCAIIKNEVVRVGMEKLGWVREGEFMTFTSRKPSNTIPIDVSI